MEKKEVYEIYMGFNDVSTNKEIVTPGEVIEIIEKYVSKKGQGFSIIRTRGAYSHLVGTMTFENSLILRMIGWDGQDAEVLARALKMYLNQESMIINRREVEVEYI